MDFVSSQEAFDTSSPYGDLIMKILAVFAEFERNSIIARVTQAYEHRSEMGFYMGGRRPYGYDLEGATINNIQTKRLVPNADEAEHIKYIFEAYAVENVTLGRLLKNLKDNDISALSGGGWTAAKLSTILKNPIYVKADSRVYDFYQRLARNKQIRNSVSNKTSRLCGKLVCEKCGRTMTTIKGKVNGDEIRRYFNCTDKSHFRDCTGTRVTIYADSIEDMVYDAIGKKA